MKERPEASGWLLYMTDAPQPIASITIRHIFNAEANRAGARVFGHLDQNLRPEAFGAACDLVLLLYPLSVIFRASHAIRGSKWEQDKVAEFCTLSIVGVFERDGSLIFNWGPIIGKLVS